MMRRIKLNWIFWHRWLGIITCVGILMWGVSGISHPIMSRIQPKPVAFSAPPVNVELHQAKAVDVVLNQHRIAGFSHVSLAQFSDKTYYRVANEASEPARYFDVETGEELAGGDAKYAKSLAAHFTGKDVSEITKTELITAFSHDYHAVNRLLPVWRVEFDDGQHLRAFIDTEQSRLSTLVNDTRYWLTRLFQFGHNWSFLEFAPKLQLSIAGLVLVTVLTSAVSGLYLYVKLGKSKQRLANQPMRRWHRRIGLIVSIAALIFASSGLFHLMMSYQQQANALIIKTESMQTAQLNPQIWAKITAQHLVKLDLIAYAGVPYWYVLNASTSGENQMPVAQVGVLAKEAEHAEHHNHHDHENAKPKPILPYVVRADIDAQEISNAEVSQTNSVENLAKQRVASLTKKPLGDIVSTEWVTKFANEYGFIFKRLPVVKVQMQDADNTRYYVEPATGALAAKVRDIDGLEGFVFAYLHKWSFEGLNKDLRDVLVSLFALGNIVVAIMGLILFLRRYPR
ncbi:MAG: PepSY domain-containing protein [Methylotenera sp.]|nr:PepSY domain-containing protein [Methylotenera sp.]